MQKETPLWRAKGERCLAAASSSKQIGASRGSDLQWIKGRALSGHSVVIEAERAIFSGARGKSYLSVGIRNIRTKAKDDRRRSR